MMKTKMATRVPQRMDSVTEQSRRQEGRTEVMARKPGLRGLEGDQQGEDAEGSMGL